MDTNTNTAAAAAAAIGSVVATHGNVVVAAPRRTAWVVVGKGYDGPTGPSTGPADGWQTVGDTHVLTYTMRQVKAGTWVATNKVTGRSAKGLTRSAAYAWCVRDNKARHAAAVAAANAATA